MTEDNQSTAVIAAKNLSVSVKGLARVVDGLDLRSSLEACWR